MPSCKKQIKGYFLRFSNVSRLERNLEKERKKHRSIIETINEGIWIVDSEARITYINKKMAELLGYDQNEMIGRYSWDFTDEENRPVVKKNFEKRKRGIYERYEFKFIRKDESVLLMSKDENPGEQLFSVSIGEPGKHPVSDREVVIEELKAQGKWQREK